MNMKDIHKVRIVVKRVGHKPEIAEVIDDPETFRQLVGGWIEVVRIGGKVIMIVDEDGLIKQKDFNFIFNGHRIVGNVFFCSYNNEGDMTSLSDEQIKEVKSMFQERSF